MLTTSITLTIAVVAATALFIRGRHGDAVTLDDETIAVIQTTLNEHGQSGEPVTLVIREAHREATGASVTNWSGQRHTCLVPVLGVIATR